MRQSMSSPRIWEALNSGNLQLLTEILQETTEELKKENDDYDIPRWCMYCGARTKEKCTCGPIAQNN